MKHESIYIKFIGLTQKQLDKFIKNINREIELNANIFKKANNKKISDFGSLEFHDVW